MKFTSSNSLLKSDFLGDGEYYVFSPQEEQFRIGYIYTTWCNSPYGMYMKLANLEIGKPLPLVIIGDSNYDEGQLKMFRFDSRNFRLIDDVYSRAMSWLNKMQSEVKYPYLDESKGCIATVIQVEQGVLSGYYRKDDYLKNAV